MSQLDRIELKLFNITSQLREIQKFLEKLLPDHSPSTDGPPYTGPAVYQRTLTQEDLSRAFQDGRHSHHQGMP